MGKLNKPRGRVGAGFTRTESTKTVDGRKLLGNVELSRAITRAGVPRGVAVASIARLPSSTDDPPSSGSTADRHKFASRAILVFPKTSPAPRLPAVPSRESPFEPRPVGTVPECVPPRRHTLDEDSPANGNVSRAGDCCGEGGLGSSRRWHDQPPPRI